MLSDACAADSFLKTWRQKKKLLNTSNFFFCHHVFNSIQLLFFHLKGFFVLFCLDVFKVVCWSFVVYWKRLIYVLHFPAVPRKASFCTLKWKRHTLSMSEKVKRECRHNMHLFTWLFSVSLQIFMAILTSVHFRHMIYGWHIANFPSVIAYL